MREVAKQNGVCTQMGNQGTAEGGLRRAVELIQAGVIGPVKEFHVWTNRPIWPQAPTVTARAKEAPAPAHVHFDLFLGPAPDRPYGVYPDGRPAYHPFAWRGWWDFGTGALGDMACHTANMGFMALKLQFPTSCAAEAGDVNPETCPSWATVAWEFPARDGMPPLKMFWYEGRKNGAKNLPPKELLHGEDPKGSGSLLVGEKGILFSPNDYGAQYIYLPKEKFSGDFKDIPERLPRNGRGDDGMKQEWVEAIKQNKPSIALSNFDYAGVFTEAVLLGNVAIRCGKKLEWDAYNLKATNCPAADQYVKREYRKGWTL
jgi:predicted dehydrogenase